MKRHWLPIATTTLALLLTLPAVSPIAMKTVHAQTIISVQIDGKQQSYDQVPVVKDDRVYVPMRGIFEALGVNVDWVAASRKVIATNGTMKIELPLDGQSLRINGENYTDYQRPLIIQDRVMVPLRFVSELLGANVTWDAATKVVRIQTDGLRLFRAIDNGDIETAKQLLKNGIDPDSTAYFNTRALEYAYKKRNWPILGILLANGADRGRTFLRRAVSSGEIETVCFYVENQVPNEKDLLPPEDLALVTAAKNNNTSMVRTLLALVGTNPNTRASYNEDRTPEPLIQAIDNRNLEMVRDLLNAGSDVKAKLTRDNKPFSLLFGPAMHNNGSILRLLLEHGADPNVQDEQGWTALMIAAEHGNTDAVNALLQAHANPDITNVKGATAYLIAEAHGNEKTIKVLEAAGVQRGNKVIYTKDSIHDYEKKSLMANKTWSSLGQAIYFGDTYTVQSLLYSEKNLNSLLDALYATPITTFIDDAPNQEILKALATEPRPLDDSRKMNLLYLAIENGNLEMAKFLLNTGLKADEESLSKAILRNDLEMIELLLQHHELSQFLLENRYLLKAMVSGHVQTAKLLLSFIDPAKVDTTASVLLFLSIVQGDIEMTQMLLDFGANPDASFNGQTPMDRAKELGFPTILSLLEQARHK